MTDVVARFEAIVHNLSENKLRSRVINRKEFFLVSLFKGVAHWLRRMSYVRRGLPAIPSRS
jgi:hypothetical protein